MPESAPTWAEFIGGIELFIDPILCGAAAGLVLGLLGVYIVLRRMVFVPLAVTHAAGLGVALAFYAEIHWATHFSPVLGAFVLGIGTTLLLALKPAPRRLTSDSVVGLIYIVAAGTAVLIASRISQESHEIDNIIFGTAVMVSEADLHATLLAGGGVLAAQLWLRRGLVFASFDRDGARVQKLPVRLLDAVLLVSIGLMVSVTTRALGAMPVFAFCVLPAMAALGLVRRIYVALALAALFGLLAAVVGYVVSFFLQFPVGASQTVVAAAITAVAMLTSTVLRR